MKQGPKSQARSDSGMEFETDEKAVFVKKFPRWEDPFCLGIEEKARSLPLISTREENSRKNETENMLEPLVDDIDPDWVIKVPDAVTPCQGYQNHWTPSWSFKLRSVSNYYYRIRHLCRSSMRTLLWSIFGSPFDLWQNVLLWLRGQPSQRLSPNEVHKHQRARGGNFDILIHISFLASFIWTVISDLSHEKSAQQRGGRQRRFSDLDSQFYSANGGKEKLCLVVSRVPF